MIRSINYCFQSKVLATFYCNNGNVQTILVGYVEKFNDSEILIAHISPRGFYDGFILKHIEEIQRIDYDSDYEKKIARLYNLRGRSHTAIQTFDPKDDEIIYSLLDFAKQNDYVVSLEFTQDSISGFVNGYSDDVVYIDAINDYGAENGIAIIDINEVLTVSVDTDHEQDLRLLTKG